jgi:hypothetical protein
MKLFQNLILFTNHYEDLQEMLEMASFLKYVDLYLTSEWGRFYMGHSVDANQISKDKQKDNAILLIHTKMDILHNSKFSRHCM